MHFDVNVSINVTDISSKFVMFDNLAQPITRHFLSWCMLNETVVAQNSHMDATLLEHGTRGTLLWKLSIFLVPYLVLFFKLHTLFPWTCIIFWSYKAYLYKKNSLRTHIMRVNLLTKHSIVCWQRRTLLMSPRRTQ